MNWRDMACAFALIAIILRAFIPVGFMPGDGRGHAIVICSGDHLSQIAVGLDGRPLPDHGRAHDQPCGFSLNVASLGGTTPVVLLPPVFAEIVPDFAVDTALSSHTPSGYSSRAPPIA
jgi:hypothetical protein